MTLPKLTSPALDSIPWVSHGFFTRRGGAGQGLYATLNCAFSAKGDPRETVIENRSRVARALGLADADDLLTLDQRHTCDALAVTSPWKSGARPIADGHATAKAGLALGVLTADCVPVLFASAEVKVIGAAHAGWKGALSGVLESTVARMREAGAAPSGIHAVIGPCIGPKSYEVGAAFREPFLAQDEKNDRFFKPGPAEGKLFFDLPGYAAARLRAMGLGGVHDLARDTLSDEETFFSYRRSTLRGEADYGRQIAVIALKA